ncbi:MAG: FAD-binding oxidoreductase [Propionibacterium sp.]
MTTITDLPSAEFPADPASQLETLLAGIDGEYFGPTHPGWDRARQAWNLAVDQHPVAVVEPLSAADVSAVLRAAGQLGMRVAPQATGHGASTLGDLSGTVLLQTRRMNEVTVDAARMIARVGAGAVWADVVGPAAALGLAALAGSSPDVGVVGYTLGGGFSWLSRSHGLAANSVTAIELVTADGVARRIEVASPDALGAGSSPAPDSAEAFDAELAWALRGGGGDFAVVTALEFRLYPITEVCAGALMWPIERAAEVLHAWREWACEEPPSVTSVARLLRLPPLPELPPFLRGRSLVVVEAVAQEPADVGDELIGRLRELGPEIDTFATVPVAELSALHMDPPGPVPGVGDGVLIDALTPELVDALVDVVGPVGTRTGALLSVELRHLGGALASSRGEGGVVAGLDAEAALYMVGIAPVPPAAAAVRAGIDAVLAAVAPWRSRVDFSNFAETRRDPRTLFGNDVERLRALHRIVDPKGIIRSNHPVG